MKTLVFLCVIVALFGIGESASVSYISVSKCRGPGEICVPATNKTEVGSPFALLEGCCSGLLCEYQSDGALACIKPSLGTEDCLPSGAGCQCFPHTDCLTCCKPFMCFGAPQRCP
eukprot:m.203165 g.203165  ORF g.203165 m.203165 type:complete len:115 (+) comp39619_c0_seq61:586-930(+)